PAVPVMSEESAARVRELRKRIASKDARELDPFIATLKDPDANVRAEAARSLATFKDKRAVAPLIGALKDEDQQVRTAAVRSLGTLGDEQAVEPMLAALRANENMIVRYDVVNALNGIGSAAVPALIKALKDPEKRVRKTAAGA